MSNIGKRFCRLVVVESAGRNNRNQEIWKLRCDCGAFHVARADHVSRGLIRSCGCLKTHLQHTFHLIHGKSKSRAYNTWASMKQRCEDKNCRAFVNYGARGIRVCRRWSDFRNFYEDMGDPPKGKQIERINNDRGYSPSNCVWATRTEQARNRRNTIWVTINGERKSLAEWSERSAIGYRTIRQRLLNGWPPEQALKESVK